MLGIRGWLYVKMMWPTLNQRIINLIQSQKKKRIYKADGWVSEGRVKGNLNLTRGFGDLEYKQNKNLKPEEQMITANSDIKVVDFIENLLLIIKEKYKKLINFF